MDPEPSLPRCNTDFGRTSFRVQALEEGLQTSEDHHTYHPVTFRAHATEFYGTVTTRVPKPLTKHHSSSVTNHLHLTKASFLLKDSQGYGGQASSHCVAAAVP